MAGCPPATPIRSSGSIPMPPSPKSSAPISAWRCAGIRIATPTPQAQDQFRLVRKAFERLTQKPDDASDDDATPEPSANSFQARQAQGRRSPPGHLRRPARRRPRLATVTVTVEGREPCGDCNAPASASYGRTSMCSHCHGSGRVRSGSGLKSCSHCHGKGFYHRHPLPQLRRPRLDAGRPATGGQRSARDAPGRRTAHQRPGRPRTGRRRTRRSLPHPAHSSAPAVPPRRPRHPRHGAGERCSACWPAAASRCRPSTACAKCCSPKPPPTPRSAWLAPAFPAAAAANPATCGSTSTPSSFSISARTKSHARDGRADAPEQPQGPEPGAGPLERRWSTPTADPPSPHRNTHN